MAHFTYIWIIENVSFPCDVVSPVFTVKEMDKTKWYLRINYGAMGYVKLSIFRNSEDDGPNSIQIKFKFAFLGSSGLPLIEKEGDLMFTNSNYFEFGSFANSMEIFLSKRTQFFPKDKLTIRCQMWRTEIEISQIDSCFARTHLRPDRQSFVWAIRKFSTLQRNHVRKILLKKNQTNALTFKLFLSKTNKEEYVNISTQCSDSEWHEVKICLLDFEGKVARSAIRSGNFIEDHQFKNFIKRSRLMNDKESLLPNDVMTLTCDIELYPKIVWSAIENYRYLNWMSSRIVSTDEGEVLHLEEVDISNVTSSSTETMKSLIEEGTLSDVSLRTDSKSFPAHKCILSARSPVFKAMFTGDMKEKTSNCVEIPDVDEDTLGELLSYIYLDRVGHLQLKRAINLYKAADKYELLDLKRKCSDFLKSDLSMSSVCDILSIADMHHDTELREAAQDFLKSDLSMSNVCDILSIADMLQDTELREAAQDFIIQVGAKFFTTEAWLRFKVENSLLAFDILEKIVCHMK